MVLPPAEWSAQDVVETYLKPTNFEHLAKAFVEQHITGSVLLALEVSAVSNRVGGAEAKGSLVLVDHAPQINCAPVG